MIALKNAVKFPRMPAFTPPRGLALEPYSAQRSRWPKSGKRLLAQYDSESIILYQAYRPAIAAYAVAHRRLGGDGFRLGRMSWVKPNFLWMMYRSGWASKPDQEAVLALRISRSAFESVLAQAVHSRFEPEIYASRQEWQQAVGSSEVRLQWDPDHEPGGAPQRRRAIQLGLAGDTLQRLAEEWLVDVEDISEYVRALRPGAAVGKDDLLLPREDVYPLGVNLARRLGADTP